MQFVYTATSQVGKQYFFSYPLIRYVNSERLTLRLNNLYTSEVRCCRSFRLRSRDSAELDTSFSRARWMRLDELETESFLL